MDTWEIAGCTLEYIDETHTYLIDGVIVPSITQMLKFKFSNKYKGINPQTLKRASERGTEAHKAIEEWCKHGTESDLPELRNFKFLKKNFNFEVLDNEVPVILFKDSEPVAGGRLDLVLEINGERGLADIILAGSDETSTAKQITAYNKYSPEVKSIIGRISTHTYDTRRIKQLGALMKAEKRNLWMSETHWSNEAGKNAGDMRGGLWIAKKIISDINGLSASAWVLWQVIDFHVSEEGYMGNKDSGMPDIRGGFWGLAVADHDKKEIVLSHKYYAMGQFSKYIRPGDSLIYCDSKTLAAYNEKTGKIVIVAINDTSKAKHRTFSLEGFSKTGNSAEIIRTSGSLENGEKWANIGSVDIVNNKLEVELKSNSVTTLVIK
jgi:O-glycosyl hydrolase